MRPFEIALLTADFILVIGLVSFRLRVSRLLAYIFLGSSAVCAILQIVLEGIRWQMVPAYCVTPLILAAWWCWPTLSTHLHRRKHPRLIGGLGVGLASTAILTSAFIAFALPVFNLPTPDGPYQIGTVTYHWTEKKSELFSSNPTDHRQLMAQIWYPATALASASHESYLPDAAALSAALGRSAHLPPFLLSHLNQVTTHAVPSAAVASNLPNYPVLIFLTGVVGYRQSNTVQVEHLVSHGYIVVGLDQPYAAGAVQFPNGETITGLTRDQIQPLINQSLAPSATPPSINGKPQPNGILPYLSDDVYFAIDQLTTLNAHDPNGLLTNHLDLKRLGVFGVSLGAMVTGQACQADTRIKACLMMDAAMPADAVRTGLHQPAMWLTRPADDMRLEGWAASDISLTTDSMRATFNKQPSGEGYYVQIPGMFHVNFTDGPLFSPFARQLGFSGPIGTRGLSIVNDYSLAFFDRYFYDRPSPLLDGTKKADPTVLFEHR